MTANPTNVLEPELLAMKRAAREAATLIMGIYAADFTVEWKGKNDPVTRADREANELIVTALSNQFPSYGILAEESAPTTAAEMQQAQRHERIFCIDPIDGTREFVDRNGEFCVMIGLVNASAASAGVIAVPVSNQLFYGSVAHGTFVEPLDGGGPAVRLSLSAASGELRALVSRSHTSQRTARLLDALGIQERLRCGSVGVKATRILEGQAELYVHPSSGCKLWDACAPDALLQGAGGVLTDLHGAAIDYRGDLAIDSGLIACHRSLHARVVAAGSALG